MCTRPQGMVDRTPESGSTLVELCVLRLSPVLSRTPAKRSPCERRWRVVAAPRRSHTAKRNMNLA